MDIENSQNPSVAAPPSSGMHKYITFIIVATVLVVAASWMMFGTETLLNMAKNPGAAWPRQPIVLAESEVAFDQSPESLGMLYLTLAYPQHNFPGPYVFDVAKRELVGAGDPNVYTIYNDFSADGFIHAFTGTTDSELATMNGQYDKALQIYIAPASESTAYPDQSAVTKITDIEAPLKRWVSVNDNGNVLFSARGNLVGHTDISNQVLSEVREWSIYSTAVGVETKFLTNGTHPKWVSDTKFIYLGEHGVYVYDTESAFSILIIETEGNFEGKVYSNNNLDLSDDNSTVALSLPNSGQIFIFKVADWDTLPIHAEVIGDIPAHAFWVTISPDTTTVAVQAVDWDTLQDAPNPRIEFYSLETLEKVMLDYPLARFDQKRMFLTDWR